jgi:putative RecB family exonuclease
MTIYSHSRISTFEQCPLKFKFRYIDNLVPEIKQTIEGFLGNKVHETLEFIYTQILNNKTVQLDDAIEFYIQAWNKDFSNEIKITKENYDSEHYFNKGIRFLIDYFLANHPFQDNTIAIEKEVFIDLDNEGKYKIRGFIDRIAFNKETNTYEIHDYKTGEFAKSQEDLDKDRQLALYSLGIKNSLENVNNILLVWHFLDINKKMTSKRTDEQLEKLKQELIELIKKIESTTDFQANPGTLCNWCEFRKYCDFKKI